MGTHEGVPRLDPRAQLLAPGGACRDVVGVDPDDVAAALEGALQPQDELRVPVGVGDEGVEAAVVPAAGLPAVYQGTSTAVPLWKCRAV